MRAIVPARGRFDVRTGLSGQPPEFSGYAESELQNRPPRVLVRWSFDRRSTGGVDRGRSPRDPSERRRARRGRCQLPGGSVPGVRRRAGVSWRSLRRASWLRSRTLGDIRARRRSDQTTELSLRLRSFTTPRRSLGHRVLTPRPRRAIRRRRSRTCFRHVRAGCRAAWRWRDGSPCTCARCSGGPDGRSTWAV